MLNHLNAQHSSSNGISCYSRVLDHEEGSNLFNGYGKRLFKLGREKVNRPNYIKVIKKGFIPVQLQIENHAPQAYHLKKANISVPVKSDKEVIKKIASNNVWKILGIFFGGLILTGLAIVPITAGAIVCGIHAGANIFLSGYTIGIPAASLVSIGGTAGTIGGTVHYVQEGDRKHAPVIRDYYQNALPDEITLAANSKINRLIFVEKKDLQPFTITLEDQSLMNRDITLNIPVVINEKSIN